MADLDHQDHEDGILDLVDDPVIADAEAV